MSIEFSKEGMALAAKLNADYSRRVEEECQKRCIDSSNPKYSDWPKERIECYNTYIRHSIEKEIHDEVYG